MIRAKPDIHSRRHRPAGPSGKSVPEEMQNVLFRAAESSPNRERLPLLVDGGQQTFFPKSFLQRLLRYWQDFADIATSDLNDLVGGVGSR